MRGRSTLHTHRTLLCTLLPHPHAPFPLFIPSHAPALALAPTSSPPSHLSLMPLNVSLTSSHPATTCALTSSSPPHTPLTPSHHACIPLSVSPRSLPLRHHLLPSALTHARPPPLSPSSRLANPLASLLLSAEWRWWLKLVFASKVPSSPRSLQSSLRWLRFMYFHSS